VSALVGQHVLVTGANRGIGAAIVRELAAHGAAVTLMVRDRESAARIAKSVSVRIHIVSADVTDRAAVERGCADAAAALGPVDILVNNAGTVETVPFLKATPDTFLRMFGVHVLGAVHTMQAVLPAMLARGRGHHVCRTVTQLSASCHWVGRSSHVNPSWPRVDCTPWIPSCAPHSTASSNTSS
jgi:NAD(P)-dependent dehydrogenase (short-subunit alcohol dehydrogenase family)